MPAGMGEEERFAAAVEHGTTPASSGAATAARTPSRASWRSWHCCAPAVRPSRRTPAARERAKQRLMAAFARVEHDVGHADDTRPERHGDRTPVAVAEPPRRRATPSRRRLRRAPRGRPALGARRAGPDDEGPARRADASSRRPRARNVRRCGAATAGTRVGHRRAALLGPPRPRRSSRWPAPGTFASQDALPGDPMYGVKRVAESTGYALTFGEQAKARRHLEQAQRRLDEVEGMVAREPAPSGPAAPPSTAGPGARALTMQEFDSDTSEGSRLLLAGPTPDTAQVDEVRTWATEQSARLSELRSTLPAPDRADESLALLDRLLGETAALQDAACDPAVVACPDGSVTGDPAETGLTSDPDGTTARHAGRARTSSARARRRAAGRRRRRRRRRTRRPRTTTRARPAARPTTTGRTTGTAATPAARAGRAAARAGPAAPPAAAPVSGGGRSPVGRAGDRATGVPVGCG